MEQGLLSQFRSSPHPPPLRKGVICPMTAVTNIFASSITASAITSPGVTLNRMNSNRMTSHMKVFLQ